MKKFFSILCALAIVLGVNAAQVSKKDVLAGKVAKKEIRSQHASTHVAKSATFKAFDNKTTSVAKVAAKNHVAAGKEMAGVEKKNLKANVAFKAPQAKKEVISFDLNTENAEIEWEDYCATQGWWQIQAENDEVYFSISNMDREVAAGEYAWEDLDPDYTCVFVEDWVYFTDGSCTVTVDDSDVLKVTVEGSFTGEDGNTYNVKIVYGETPIVPGDIDFVAVTESHTFYASDNDVYYRLYDANDNVIYFDIVVAEGLEDVEAGKTYTLEDMLADYTKVNFDGTNAALTEVSFVKSYEGLTEKIEATATDEFGRVFHVSYSFSAPVAEKFETITAEATITKEAYWFWYLYTIEAADEANSIILEILPDDTYYGTWEAGKDITGAVAPLNGEESLIYSGEVTIEPTAEGCTITGKVLCMNNTEYTLNLTYTKPGPTREEVLIVEGLELGVYDGAWQLSGYNEDSTKFVSMAAYTDEITGNYTDADLAADYCYVVTDITEEGYNYFDMLSADLTVQFNEADSTIIIAGTFVGQNGEDIPQFTMLLKGRIPAPEVSDMTFAFSESEEGITVTPSNDEDAWDWYVVDAETFEYYGADGIAEVIYSNYGDYYAVTGEQLLTFDGDLAYYTAEAGIYYLVVWGAGAQNITTPAESYQFEIEQGSGSPYDAEEDFIVDFAEYEINDEYLESYGVLFVNAQNELNEYISIELWLPEGATGLAAGEYTVSAEEMVPQTVTACSVDQYIYGSFAGTLDADGYVNIPFWFFAEGTVTVSENGAIAVDVLNTKGAAIKCNLAATQGIENVTLTEDAKKVVVDGVLYIVRDGKMFNVQGAQVR
jgi:hypothetical protein